MGQVETLVVSEFLGLSSGFRQGERSTRRGLDTPRELINLLVNEDGHLWLPAAHEDTLIPFAGGTVGTRVKAIIGVTSPRSSWIIQLDTKVYYSRITETAAEPVLLVDTGSELPVWTVEINQVLYFGNSDSTWKVTTESFTVEEITDETTPHGFHSAMYRGRRFVLKRNYTVWFSDLNQPETFGDNSSFPIAGDDSGGSWVTNSGSVIRLMEIGDYLTIFCTQSVWLLSGTTPESFMLKRTDSIAGAWARDSVVRVDEGILFFGGTPIGEFGMYLFTGGSSQLISGPINDFFREWTRQLSGGESLFDVASESFNAARWNNYIFFYAPEIDSNRVMYVFDLLTKKWSTFDGWTSGRVTTARELIDFLVISDGQTLYRTTDAAFRASGSVGTATFGWEDQGYTTGFMRFLAVKVSGWKTAGTGDVTIDLTISTPEGGEVTTSYTIGTDVFEGVSLPVNLRGKAVEFKIDVTPASDTQQVVIEQIQLVYSAKGEKVGRA